MSRSRDAADQINRVNSSAADATAITIDSSENVGIGTSSITSSFKMEVIGDARFSDVAGDDGVELGWSSGGSQGFVQAYDRGASAFRDLTINNSMTITSTGNAGIGITSPTQALVVSESSTPTIQIKDGLGSGTRVSGRLHIGESDTLGVSIENSTNSYNDNCTMVFKTSPAAGTITERLRLTSAGEMLIGKTSFNNDIGCAFNQNGVGYFVAGGGSVPLLVNSITSNNTQTLVQFYKNSSGVGSISSTGSSTAYNTSSDYRLKTDVQPMVGASARVQALNPVNFEWISDGTRVDGFLAHEAATVVPEAITGEKDAMRDEEYEVTPAVEATFDEEGNVLTEAVEAVMGTRNVPDYQGIDQSKIVPLLTAALQEALTKIDSLETRLTALEG
jgi:hypothetical protein